MTTRMICVLPELSVAAVEALLLENGISGAPVVDGFGRPFGTVCTIDLIRHQQQCGIGRATEQHVVADIMVPEVFCLAPNDTIARAAAVMARKGVNLVPIVDGHRHVVGLVSPVDLLRWNARRHGDVTGQGA